MIRKFRVPTFIVPRAGIAVPTPATRLWNFTTDSVNLAVGNFGVYRPVANSGNPEVAPLTPTLANTKKLQFILHRDQSADTTPLAPYAFIKSPEIDAECPVSVTLTNGSAKHNMAWVVGDLNANAGKVPVNDETEYILNASIHGWRTDLYNGLNTPLRMGRFTTPDYFSSTLYTTEIQRRDHLLHNLAYDFNTQSMGEVVCLCLDAAGVAPGAGGAVSLATIAGYTPGTTIVVGYKDDGQPIRMTLDRDLIKTFNELATALGGTVKVVPYARPTGQNLAVATRIVAGGRTAGTPQSNVDHLVLIPLDQKRAAYDEVSQTKERIIVGLDGGFGSSVNSRTAVRVEEGSGYGRDLMQQYLDFQGHREYPGGKRWQPNSVHYPNEILENGLYDIFVITTCENRTASSGMPSQSPQVIKIAILNTTTSGFAGFTGVTNPQRTYLVNLLNSWMASTSFPHTTLV